jgi:hypothetical protein
MGYPAKREFHQPKFVVKDPQACCLFNPEMATKHLARTERSFCRLRVNCFIKIIRQRRSGPGIVKHIRFPLLKSPPRLPCLGRASASRPETHSSSVWIFRDQFAVLNGCQKLRIASINSCSSKNFLLSSFRLDKWNK